MFMEKKKPEISIIVPIYNVETYLARCLDSVLGQSFGDFEIILMNDGSTDGSEKICKDYAARDARIHLVSQKNQGLSMARNNSLPLAQGKYIVFLDSDDSIHPQLLEAAHALAEKEAADMVCFQYKRCSLDGESDRRGQTLSPDRLAYRVFTGDEVCFYGLHRKSRNIHYNVWSKLYRKELIEGLSFIPHIRYEDVPFTYAVLARHPKTVLLDEELYYYTLSPNSLYRASGEAQHIRDYWTGVKSIYDIYKEKGREKELAFLKKDFIPNILRQELAHCHRADSSQKPAMFREFARELSDLRSKDLILEWHWMNIVFLTYFRLMYTWYCRIKRG